MQINLDELHQNETNFIKSIVNDRKYLHGCSIVSTCYDQEIPSMWVLLHELKRLGTTLPIEIFYRDNELSQYQIYLLESIIPSQIKVKKIKGTPKDFISKYGHKHGWSCKIYAILESEYEQNLWIDADNTPIVDPSFLFDDEEYKSKGSLFWRDMFSPDSADTFSSTSAMWPIFNVPFNDSEPFESGQLLINKKKCYKELSLLQYYADNCDIYYNFGGDKETFKFAFQRIGIVNGLNIFQINYHSNPNVPFGMMPYGCISKGRPNQYKKWGGGSIMVHRDRHGKELFNHRNMTKFTIRNNVFNIDITNEHYYHMYIEKLKNILGEK